MVSGRVFHYNTCQKDFKPALKLLKNSLSETGFFILAFMGNKEIRDTLGRYYSYYGESEISEIIQSLNLKIFSLDKLESKSFDKKINTMHLLIKKINKDQEYGKFEK